MKPWIPSAEDLEKERAWIEREMAAIGLRKLEETARAAIEAASRAYSPYSNFVVGASILDTKGDIYTGQNIEIATYSETGHAEEQAIKNAISAGAIQAMGRQFIRVVCATAVPCGRCRQIIAEFSANPLIVVVDAAGKIRTISSLGIMLPLAFTPSDIRKK